ncbi:MAG TPA: hypothetical protein PL009_09350 [Flavipsychrobacter sp.]|nr:hypothetical protein [Flavipsychrobacter sp.]
MKQVLSVILTLLSFLVKGQPLNQKVVRYSTGEVKEIYPMRNNKINGWVQFYAKNGVKWKEFEVRENKPIGMVKRYNNEKELIEMYEFDHEREMRQGRCVEFHEGKKKGEGNYRNGEKEGEWVEYYGETTEKCRYSNGEKNGPYRKFKKNKLIETGKHKDGCPNDTVKTFNERGAIIRTMVWAKCHGYEIR